MLQCQDCEFFDRTPDGMPILRCDPFSNIKAPECLQKWQLLNLQRIVRAHEATIAVYERLAPLQEKMMKHIEQEIDEIDDADRWKYGPADDEDERDDAC